MLRREGKTKSWHGCCSVFSFFPFPGFPLLGVCWFRQAEEAALRASPPFPRIPMHNVPTLAVVPAAADRTPPQLKPFYMDFVSQLPASPNQSAVRGLNLLFLLVENRLAEFHSELELMGDAERASECVMFPVRLERFLMVGSYDQARSRMGSVVRVDGRVL